MKIVKIEEVKIPIFWETWLIPMRFLRKNVTYVDIKVTKKPSFTPSWDSKLF